MFCCSNSTSQSGSFIDPLGNQRTGDFWNNYGHVRRYADNHTYAGCNQLYFCNNQYYLGSYGGIYTCKISDSNGDAQTANIAVYDYNYNYYYSKSIKTVDNS